MIKRIHTAELKTAIYDLNSCPLSERNGFYGGMAGSKEGILIDNEYWIVKYPKSTKGYNKVDVSYTTSPLSEYIGSHIYEILGYDVHNTILGIRNNKLVVACKDFCENRGDLFEIRTLKNIYNEKLEKMLEDSFESTGSSHIVQLNELLIHFQQNPVLSKIEGIKERFWECALIDGLINNNDRNNGNWGLLKTKEETGYRLAPIFDNGASFSNKHTDEKLQRILENGMENSSINILTAYGKGEHHYNINELLNMEDFPELQNAILKVVPLIKENFDIIKSFIQNIPNEYRQIPVCSDIKKEFYCKGMEIRLAKSFIPAYEKTITMKKREDLSIGLLKEKAISKINDKSR